jgi:hypothetical protein
LVVLVSTYYHLLARNVSWTVLVFRRHSPFLNPCLSHHHHRHHLRSVRRSQSSLLVASTWYGGLSSLLVSFRRHFPLSQE